jgi:hypothetical protein
VNVQSGIEGLAELGSPLNVSTAEALIETVDVNNGLDDADLAIADATKGIGSVGAKSSKKTMPMFSPPASNRFMVHGYQYHRIDSSSDQVSYRITLASAISINQIYVYVPAIGSNSNKNFRVGIQGDSSGNPDGTFDCSFTFQSGSGTGWKSSTSLSCGSYSAGQVIHTVIEYSSGGGNWDSNWVDLISTNPWNRLRPYDGSSDTNSNVLLNTGSGWTAQNLQPVVIVKETSGGQDGNSYYSGASANIWGVPTWLGQGNKFQVSSATTMNQAEFFIAHTSGSGTAPVTLTIRNISDNFEMVTTSVPPSAIPSGSSCADGNWITFNFPIQSFVTGKTYAIYLNSSSGIVGYYTCLSITDNTSPQNLLTFSRIIPPTTSRSFWYPSSPKLSFQFHFR